MTQDPLYVSPWRPSGPCASCGGLTERADLGGGELVSCGGCGTVRPVAEIEADVEERAVRFAAAYPTVHDLPPLATETKIRGALLAALHGKASATLLADAIACWAQVRLAVPAVEAENAVAPALRVELRRRRRAA